MLHTTTKAYERCRDLSSSWSSLSLFLVSTTASLITLRAAGTTPSVSLITTINVLADALGNEGIRASLTDMLDYYYNRVYRYQVLVGMG